MNPDELAELLATGWERFDVEFKSPGARTDKAYLGKVTRAVLAMSNRRDGGMVVLGVDERRSQKATLLGLTSVQLGTWKSDDARDALASYAEPSVEVDVHQVTLDDKTAVILQVREFADVPVLCRKDGVGLREGALYVRSRRKPESVEVPRQAEMREVIELAMEKRLRSFLGTAAAAGLRPLSVQPIAAQATSDETHYQQQTDSLLKEASEKAKSRGYWQVCIHPLPFLSRRVKELLDLVGIMRATAVEYRGWPYPSVLARNDVQLGKDWVEAQVDERIHVEQWRYYQSGHFAQVLGFWEDWFEQDDFTRPEDHPRPKATLGVDYTVGTLTEIFEFASRLALSAGGADTMVVRLGVYRLRGRCLTLPSTRIPFSAPRVAAIDSYQYDAVLIDRDVLLADPRTPAVAAARELFQRFGWNASIETLRGLQPPHMQ